MGFSAIFVAALLTVGGVFAVPIASLNSESIHLRNDIPRAATPAFGRPAFNRRTSSSLGSGLVDKVTNTISRVASPISWTKTSGTLISPIDIDPTIDPSLCLGIAVCNPVDVGGTQSTN